MFCTLLSKRHTVLFVAVCAAALAFFAGAAHASEKPRKKGAAASSKTPRKDSSKVVLPPERVTAIVPVRVIERPTLSPRLGAAVTALVDSALYRAERVILGIPDSVPYLQDVPAPGIRIVNTEPFIRRPPPLPKIVNPADQQTSDPAAKGANEPAPLPEDAGAAEAKNPMEEVVDFFRDSGSRQSDEKGLGDPFDPTFTPAPLPPTSTATYRRE